MTISAIVNCYLVQLKSAKDAIIYSAGDKQISIAGTRLKPNSGIINSILI